MEEIIIPFFQVAWYAIWCVGLYTDSAVGGDAQSSEANVE